MAKKHISKSNKKNIIKLLILIFSILVLITIIHSINSKKFLHLSPNICPAMQENNNICEYSIKDIEPVSKDSNSLETLTTLKNRMKEECLNKIKNCINIEKIEKDENKKKCEEHKDNGCKFDYEELNKLCEVNNCKFNNNFKYWACEINTKWKYYNYVCSNLRLRRGDKLVIVSPTSTYTTTATLT